MRAHAGLAHCGEYSANRLSGALSKEMQNSVLVQNSLISKHQKMLEAAKQETAGKEQVGAHPQRMQRSACMSSGWTALYAHGRKHRRAGSGTEPIRPTGRRSAHAGEQHAGQSGLLHRYASHAAAGLP